MVSFKARHTRTPTHLSRKLHRPTQRTIAWQEESHVFSGLGIVHWLVENYMIGIQCETTVSGEIYGFF